MTRIFLWILLTIMEAEIKGTDVCTRLQCENNSPCMTSFVKTDNGTIVSKERCLCSENYYGRHCDKQISIHDVTVTSQEAYIHTQILCNNTPCRDGKVDPDVHFEYSLQYWTNDSESSCSVRNFYGSKDPILKDLLPEAEYIVCIKSGSLNWCRTFHEVVNLTKNCVIFKTGSSVYTKDKNMMEYLLLLILLVVFAVISATFVLICRRRDMCRRYSKVPKDSEISTHLDQEFSLTCILDDRTMQHQQQIMRKSHGKNKRKRKSHADKFASFWTSHDKSMHLKSITECRYESCDNETSNMLSIENE